ncbi:MAG TPA: efflux RND transporter periplasmic adaptor subunit [Thermodesulfovibrionales bacterium]|nr:efflux RND transporter periplasmic adaptor subunit [Thermodesulfovibrionales bacterium]
MKKRYIVVLCVLILISGLMLYFFIIRGGTKKSEAVKGVVAEQSAGHAGHGGTPPVPQPTGEQPKEQKEGEETPTVEIPQDKQQMIGVKTTEAVVRPIEKIIRTVGRVEYDEKRLATINIKLEGWIEKLHVDYTGRYVRKDEPLADIYSPELIATQQEFINVLKWARKSNTPPSTEGGVNPSVSDMLSKDADTIVEAAKQRLRLWDISEEQIRKIEDSGKPIRTLTLYSPVNGYVVQKMALQGMRVMPGEKLFDIADLSTVWIISDIYEYELPLIKVGDTASIRLSYFPGKEFRSRIDYVYPTLSGETRTAKVRFTIPNPSGQLKPQMFTNVEVKIPLGKRLSIPDDAVIDTGTRQIVYVDKGDGNFEPREVMLGIRAEGFREVLKGLKAGEKVASSATFLIDSEAQLKGVKPLEHKH